MDKENERSYNGGEHDEEEGIDRGDHPAAEGNGHHGLVHSADFYQ